MGEPGNQVPRKYFVLQTVFRVVKDSNAATDNIGGKLRSSLAKRERKFLQTY